MDELLYLVNKRKEIRITEVAKIYDVPKGLAEEWARILEDNNLIKIHYPIIGSLRLRALK